VREYGREMHCEPSQISKSASIAAITNQQASQGYENKDAMMRAGGCTTNTMQHGDVGKVANDSNCNGGPDGRAGWVANWEQWMQLAKCTNLMHASARTDACVRLDIPHIPLKLGGAGLSAQWAKGCSLDGTGRSWAQHPSGLRTHCLPKGEGSQHRQCRASGHCHRGVGMWMCV